MMYLEHDLDLRYKKRIVTGLESLLRYVEKERPKAKAAWEALVAQCKGPLDRVGEDPSTQSD
jgi:hypothetical protein